MATVLQENVNLSLCNLSWLQEDWLHRIKDFGSFMHSLQIKMIRYSCLSIKIY